MLAYNIYEAFTYLSGKRIDSNNSISKIIHYMSIIERKK